MPNKNHKAKYDGHETVPENPKGGIITAIGLAAAFFFVVGGGMAATYAFGPRDENGNLPQGAQKIEFTAPEEGHQRSPEF